MILKQGSSVSARGSARTTSPYANDCHKIVAKMHDTVAKNVVSIESPIKGYLHGQNQI